MPPFVGPLFVGRGVRKLQTVDLTPKGATAIRPESVGAGMLSAMPLYVRTLVATGPPDEVREASEAHRRHLDDLRREGKLHLAGAFPDGDGFMEVLEVVDRLEAEAIARSSPLVERGLVSWTLREWTPL